MKREAYLIDNIENFGKLMAFCIKNDISVWRTYWNNNDKNTVYQIDWKQKQCFYCERCYYEKEGYEIIKPEFSVDEWGNYKILCKVEKGGN